MGTQLESHVPTLSESRLDSSSLPVTPRPGSRSRSREQFYDDDSLADQTIVDEEVIASQIGSEVELNEEDNDLVNLLADLATEATECDNGNGADSDQDIFSESENSQSPCPK